MRERLLTADQRTMLVFISQREWRVINIDRSGQNKKFAPARQQLAKRGLIEGHPYMRRSWRITEAGRQAIGLKGEA